MNIQKIMLSITLLTSVSAVYAAVPTRVEVKEAAAALVPHQDELSVQLPTKEVLNQRLTALGAGLYLADHQIDEKLGGKNMPPFKVALAVDISLESYSGSQAVEMEKKRIEILKAFFQESPEAMDDLEQRGMLEEWQSTNQ